MIWKWCDKAVWWTRWAFYYFMHQYTQILELSLKHLHDLYLVASEFYDHVVIPRSVGRFSQQLPQVTIPTYLAESFRKSKALRLQGQESTFTLNAHDMFCYFIIGRSRYEDLLQITHTWIVLSIMFAHSHTQTINLCIHSLLNKQKHWYNTFTLNNTNVNMPTQAGKMQMQAFYYCAFSNEKTICTHIQSACCTHRPPDYLSWRPESVWRCAGF